MKQVQDFVSKNLNNNDDNDYVIKIWIKLLQV